ncbi:hypothetical protein AJ80_02391 [Polytolypa hystricis UAMH7299]|uniref:Uncharacterized protein n=1 Tax=Polytolypa hystricis (strain UAMH7299) TaxID=1447883 RepID=A0A2B7YR11_POLH7|nr:hypothetical protein AJ80_02391 [Polytolypa hystricis UAMH7299]
MAASTTICLRAVNLSEKHTDYNSVSGDLGGRTQSSQHTFLPLNGESRRPEAPKSNQSVLLLRGTGEKYTLDKDYAIPQLQHEAEILVQVLAIGLNPIDWKAPAFNFGIPALPWINGRDLAGRVVRVSDGCSRVQVGDIVLVPSTDYRDIRKAAFQQYAVATHFNAARIPPTVPVHGGACLGVAFVAAALALGVSFGLDFTTAAKSCGPNLPELIASLDSNDIPVDIREECFSITRDSQQIKPGDWLAIWGASTTSGYLTLQLAKLCGLKVICVADVARHGAKLQKAGADILIDRYDTNRAVEIIRGITDGQLLYAMDMVGRESATFLQAALTTTATTQTHSSGDSSNNNTIHDRQQAHLLGLTGLPKEREDSSVIRYHTVPIKLFHTANQVGEKLMVWLEDLLRTDALILPEVVQMDGGLDGINEALEHLRNGSVSGKRIVVEI